MIKLLTRIFGTRHDRYIKKMVPVVEEINSLEGQIKELGDEDFPEKTEDFKKRLAEGEDIDNLLAEAFAVAREAAVRAVGMRPFDVQIIGALALHQGKIAEMKTGEGKTLVATMAAYLNALSGKGVHIVTVNDYLAQRDSEWMGRVYKFLGLSVGLIVHGTDISDRKDNYSRDIVYGTNNEFGFDFLRDNMARDKEEWVQRELNYCIIDEVDSILIDEARTPLIISGPSEETTDKYHKVNKIIPSLKKEEDFAVDEKSKNATLTEEGVAKCEKLLGIQNLYDDIHTEWVHHIDQALRAHHLYKKDVDYVVRGGEVLIVDEFTGRLMEGRRYSDGLHQAIEAKEKVQIAKENQTLATVTFQNYFKMYNKISGMTGTADTEAREFSEIYGLDVCVIPTNRPMVRDDLPDLIYKTEREKYNAIAENIKEINETGAPILVGTISIEKNELLSRMLSRKGVKHNVLNAKHHDREADIIAQAGRKGAVTIATNMAGRGTDIVLGGNPELLAEGRIKPEGKPEDYTALLQEMKERCTAEKKEVLDAGGLHIIGSERHESRRIDNQLRGRSGRQGDPGKSVFYLSLEDDLMRIFGSERIAFMMDKLGAQEGEVITHSLVSRSIENAQKKVEGHNFEIRKHLLEYDSVLNQQRNTIYGIRRQLLDGEDFKEDVTERIKRAAEIKVLANTDISAYPEDWNLEPLYKDLERSFGLFIRFTPEEVTEKKQGGMIDAVIEGALSKYKEKEKRIGPEMMRNIERIVLLNIIDSKWKQHLYMMDSLKSGINLRAYGQKDPLIEYKNEGFQLFEEMLDNIDTESAEFVLKAEVMEDSRPRSKVFDSGNASESHDSFSTFTSAGQAADKRRGNRPLPGDSGKPETFRRDTSKVGRNDPCPCGSGRKYKKCCGG
ncbi:MAG: preprotein translocase subunit SecA [Fibrobacterota bacterium]